VAAGGGNRLSKEALNVHPRVLVTLGGCGRSQRRGMYSIEVLFVALSMLHNNVPLSMIYKNIGVRTSTL